MSPASSPQLSKLYESEATAAVGGGRGAEGFNEHQSTLQLITEGPPAHSNIRVVMSPRHAPCR